MASYVISDTHGCLLTLRHLVEDLIAFSKNDSLFLLGDYIDRGPLSAQLLDYLISLTENGYQIFPLRGNHEQMLLDSMYSTSAYLLWLQNMGNETIASYKNLYGINFSFPQDIPKKHYTFLRSLPYYEIVNQKFLLVHGGINYYAKNPLEDTNALLWNRPVEVPTGFMPGHTIIHGHTPTPLRTILEKLEETEQRLIPLDAGCVYKGKIAGCGYLAALNLDEMSLLFCENIDF